MQIEIDQPLNQTLEQLQARRVKNQKATIIAQDLYKALTSANYPDNYPRNLTPSYDLSKAQTLDAKDLTWQRVKKMVVRLESVTIPYQELRRIQLNRALDIIKLSLEFDQNPTNLGIREQLVQERQLALQVLNESIKITPLKNKTPDILTEDSNIQFGFETAVLAGNGLLKGDEARLVYALKSSLKPLDSRQLCEAVLGEYTPGKSRYLQKLIELVNPKLSIIQNNIQATPQTQPGQSILYSLKQVVPPEINPEPEEAVVIEVKPAELETLTILKKLSQLTQELIRSVFDDTDFEFAINLLAGYLKDSRVDFYMSDLENGLFGWLIEEIAYRHTDKWFQKRSEGKVKLLSPHSSAEIFRMIFKGPMYQTYVDEWGFTEGMMGISIPDGLLITPHDKEAVFTGACEYTAINVANSDQKKKQLNGLKRNVADNIAALFDRDDELFSVNAPKILCAKYPDLAETFSVLSPERFQIYYTVLPGTNVPGVKKTNVIPLPFRAQEINPVAKALIKDGRKLLKTTGDINPKLFSPQA